MRLLSVLLGAGLMYYMDPASGSKRRRWFSEQWKTIQSKLPSQSDSFSTSFATSEEVTEPPFSSPVALDADWDKALLVRVEDAVAQRVSNSSSIGVQVRDGVVTLTGHALLPEIAQVMERVSKLPGVTYVDNRLKVRQAGNEFTEPQPESASGENGLNVG